MRQWEGGFSRGRGPLDLAIQLELGKMGRARPTRFMSLHALLSLPAFLSVPQFLTLHALLSLPTFLSLPPVLEGSLDPELGVEPLAGDRTPAASVSPCVNGKAASPQVEARWI